jgi:hypothetical protein
LTKKILINSYNFYPKLTKVLRKKKISCKTNSKDRNVGVIQVSLLDSLEWYEFSHKCFGENDWISHQLIVNSLVK